MKFSETIWAFQDAQSEFEAQLEEVGLSIGDDFGSIGWDEYDNSIELYKVSDNVRLTEDQQRIIWEAGFSRVFVNHKDGWETHYHWTGTEFAKCRGWRRRWVADPKAKTTRSVGAPVDAENAGYYEISYWPAGWGTQADKWKDNGFMRIVPDPLDAESR